MQEVLSVTYMSYSQYEVVQTTVYKHLCTECVLDSLESNGVCFSSEVIELVTMIQTVIVT